MIEHSLIMLNFAKLKQNIWQILTKKIEIAEQCKGVHCVDLGESFQSYSNVYFLAKFRFDTAENDPY